MQVTDEMKLCTCHAIVLTVVTELKDFAMSQAVT